jgi:hypothetical protein
MNNANETTELAGDPVAVIENIEPRPVDTGDFTPDFTPEGADAAVSTAAAIEAVRNRTIPREVARQMTYSQYVYADGERGRLTLEGQGRELTQKNCSGSTTRARRCWVTSTGSSALNRK